MAKTTVSEATSAPARRPPRPHSAFERDSPREPRPQSAFERSPLSARECRIYPSSLSIPHLLAHTGPQIHVKPMEPRPHLGAIPPPEGSGPRRFTRTRYTQSGPRLRGPLRVEKRSDRVLREQRGRRASLLAGGEVDPFARRIRG